MNSIKLQNMLFIIATFIFNCNSNRNNDKNIQDASANNDITLDKFINTSEGKISASDMENDIGAIDFDAEISNPSKLTCFQIINCMIKCNSNDTQCLNNCQMIGNKEAQIAFNNLKSCAETAQKDVCKEKCITLDTECTLCIDEHCSSERATCIKPSGDFSSNSGDICNPQSTPSLECKDNMDLCVFISEGALGTCQSVCLKLGELCPAEDTADTLSYCAGVSYLQGVASIGLCYNVCKIQDDVDPNKTKTYTCPNKSKDECVQLLGPNGKPFEVWFCRPK